VSVSQNQPRQPAPASRRIDYLTAPAINAFLERSDAAILPVGPTEAHGLHLPLGCDYLISLATAELAAREADALVLPPFSYSWPGATAKLPGTMRLSPDLVLSVIAGILDSAASQGFKRLAMVCAHGGDVPMATLAARWAFERCGVPVAVHHAVPGRGTTAREEALAEPALARDKEEPGYGETSRFIAALDVLGLPRELVAFDAIERGPTGPKTSASHLPAAARSAGAGFYFSELSQHIPTPASYSVEEGRAYLDATAAAIAESLAAMVPAATVTKT
jgi:hypothetical protein